MPRRRPDSDRRAPAGTGPDPSTIGYTVINLREADYLKVKAQLDAIPGLSFPSEVRNLPPTRDFARALLGQVTPGGDRQRCRARAGGR